MKRRGMNHAATRLLGLDGLTVSVVDEGVDGPVVQPANATPTEVRRRVTIQTRCPRGRKGRHETATSTSNRSAISTGIMHDQGRS
jgi:hypothetical protein